MDIIKLKQELLETRADEKDLRMQCNRMRKSFKAKYPASICPVFLARQSGLSRSPLYWRYSSKIKGKLGQKIKTSDFYSQIAMMLQARQTDILTIEYNRIKLNYQLAIKSYAIIRLELLIYDLSYWSKEVKK